MSDTMTDDKLEAATAPSSDETPETPTTTTPASSGGARPKPTYKAEKLNSNELPADLTLPRSGPRTDPKMVEAFQVAQKDAGEWYCVATFQSANGAKTLLKRIKDKAVNIPSGDWEIEARRVEAPDSTPEAPKRWSKVFAKYAG